MLLTCNSCTRAVNVPLTSVEAVEPGALYRVVTIDGRTFETRDLVVRDNVVTFSSSDHAYTLPTDTIKAIQRLEVDTPRTIVAVTVITVAIGTATYFLLKSLIGAFSGAE